MSPNRLPWKLCGTSCISLLFLRINWLHFTITHVTMPIVQVRCTTTKSHISARNAELHGLAGDWSCPAARAIHSYNQFMKWLYSSEMQQQQPGTVTHSCISSLLISRRLTRPRVALRYSVWTVTWPEVGVAPQNFGCASRASGWTPLSKFLNPPLLLTHLPVIVVSFRAIHR